MRRTVLPLAQGACLEAAHESLELLGPCRELCGRRRRLVGALGRLAREGGDALDVAADLLAGRGLLAAVMDWIIVSTSRAEATIRPRLSPTFDARLAPTAACSEPMFSLLTA